MWTRAFCFLFISIIASVNSAVPASVLSINKPTRTSTKMILTSEFSKSDFVPNGDLNKQAWVTAKKVRFDQDAFNKNKYPDIETTVASRWTKDYIYFAYWCRYKTLTTYEGENPGPERWELWKRDVVEAFIAPQPARPNHYYEFEIAPNNQWLDLEIDLDGKPPHNPNWNSGFEHSTKIDAVQHVWTVEMRIPARSMGMQHIGPDSDWRINLYRADGMENGPAQKLLSWSPLPIDNGSFHQPASFGVLQFIGTEK